MGEKPAWHELYPKPRNQSPAEISREDLLNRLQRGEKPGSDFLLIDLRKTDHEGGTIQGSINLPAQSLYPSLSTILNLCQSAQIGTVIWYCGSSKGRGTRAAGWFDDMLQDHDVKSIQSLILRDGITGWANAGKEFVALMEEYDRAVWINKK